MVSIRVVLDLGVDLQRSRVDGTGRVLFHGLTNRHNHHLCRSSSSFAQRWRRREIVMGYMEERPIGQPNSMANRRWAGVLFYWNRIRLFHLLRIIQSETQQRCTFLAIMLEFLADPR